MEQRGIAITRCPFVLYPLPSFLRGRLGAVSFTSQTALWLDADRRLDLVSNGRILLPDGEHEFPGARPLHGAVSLTAVRIRPGMPGKRRRSGQARATVGQSSREAVDEQVAGWCCGGDVLPDDGAVRLRPERADYRDGERLERRDYSRRDHYRAERRDRPGARRRDRRRRRVPPAVTASGPLLRVDRAERVQQRDASRHRADHRPDCHHQLLAEAGDPRRRRSRSPASRRSWT